jgi:hypothetical protein
MEPPIKAGNIFFCGKVGCKALAVWGDCPLNLSTGEVEATLPDFASFGAVAPDHRTIFYSTADRMGETDRLIAYDLVEKRFSKVT